MTALTARPRGPSKGRVFLFSLCVGAGVVLVPAAWNRVSEQVALSRVQARPLSAEVAVTAQLTPDLVPALASRYGTLIDIRPDGEMAGQPSAEDMRRVATKEGMGFAYVPVPHGEIPESAVGQLAAAMKDQPGPILLYCRSGRRAARTWALAEAARPGGWPADRILAAVHDAGQDAQDLRPRIEASIAARGAAK